jgi:RNA polymerase sigma-70 factor (ECF subfamily)
MLTPQPLKTSDGSEFTLLWEEVFQEASVTIWQKLDHYQPGTDFRAWASRIAYHKVLKLRERKGRAARLFEGGLLERIDEELIVMSDKLDARREALEQCRQKLSRGDRQMLDRYYSGAAGVKQLADARSWSTHKVYRALRRIHEALFACVTKTLTEIDHA